MSDNDSNVQPFVDWNWCAGKMGRFVLVDCRWYLDGSSGKGAYDAGHIPGAVFADMDQWLSGPASKQSGRNPLPDPEVFAQGMREAGINDSDTVIAYDDAGGVIAGPTCLDAPINRPPRRHPGRRSRQLPGRPRQGCPAKTVWRILAPGLASDAAGRYLGGFVWSVQGGGREES
jgi:thiosulfate/3-mercaptopyruvate sulfurtransferase